MALSFVASASGTSSGTQTQVACSSSLDVQAGDTLFAAVMWEGGETTCTVEKDTGTPTNTFTFDAADDDGFATGSQSWMAMHYKLSASADGTATFEATLGAGRNSPRIAVLQLRGGMTKDTSAIAHNNTGAPSSGNIATAVANSIVIGANANDSGLNTSSESINSVLADANPVDIVNLSVWYRILSATFAAGAATCASLGGGTEWTCGIMAFSEGGAPAPRFILGSH